MSLRLRLLSISLVAIAVTAVACLIIQRFTIRQEGAELTRSAMRGVLLSAQNVRESVAAMRERGIFAGDLTADGGGDYRNSKLYQTVPVVRAWLAIENVAAAEGYKFHIAARAPRNAKNAVGDGEEQILQRLEGGASEYFGIDEKRQQIVYARPVLLSKDCLMCHGDPATSATKDGRDILGMRMEGWRVGQIHGAFVLRTSLDHLDKVVHAGLERTLLGVLPVALLVGLLVYAVLSKLSRRLGALASRLAESSVTVTETAGHISESSQALADRAIQQAASIEETSASSNEIRAMAVQGLDGARGVKSKMHEMRSAIAQGNKHVTEVSQAVDGISASTDKIAAFVKTIDNIAFQTNILALNAAVEASRAGEAGMGFSVVAGEVRALAQRCGTASRETAALIGDSLERTKAAAGLTQRLSGVFQQITAESARVNDFVEQVAVSNEEQSRGADQIARALSSMEQTTQQTAATAEEGAAACMELNSQAAGLGGMVAALEALVGGRRS
ncbi:MAG: methyl-accepting chemotaxis protein [Bryobacteraceae bacterium]